MSLVWPQASYLSPSCLGQKWWSHPLFLYLILLVHFTGKSRCLYCKHIARIQPYLTDFSVSPLVPSKMISVASYLLHLCPFLYSHSLFAEYKPQLSLKICQTILYFASYFSLGKSQRPCNSLKDPTYRIWSSNQLTPSPTTFPSAHSATVIVFHRENFPV